MRTSLVWLGLAAALALAGCKGGGSAESEKGGTGPARTMKAEAWCDREGLTAPLRQTILMIDERVIKPGTGAAFRTNNPDLFEMLNNLGNAASGASTGTMAPRERLNLYVVPADGASPRLVFTGCAPGLSADELSEARAGRSSIGDFVGGDLAGEMEDATEAYNRQFILGSTRMGDLAAAPDAVRAGQFAQSSLLASLKSVRQLGKEGAGVPRYFIFTDLGTFPNLADATAAREAGFALAREAQLTMGGAEVVMMGPGGTSNSQARQFANAFFLGSQGELMGWGSGALGALPAAPVEVRTYSGELRYPDTRYPTRLIIGRDAQNRLVNSWLIVNSDREWATPIGGSLRCNAEVCQLVQDRSGLGQRWNPQQGGEPTFTEDLPLSGMRSIRAELTPEAAKGEVWDADVVVFEGFPGVNTLPFDLSPL